MDTLRLKVTDLAAGKCTVSSARKNPKSEQCVFSIQQAAIHPTRPCASPPRYEFCIQKRNGAHRSSLQGDQNETFPAHRPGGLRRQLYPRSLSSRESCTPLPLHPSPPSQPGGLRTSHSAPPFSLSAHLFLLLISLLCLFHAYQRVCLRGKCLRRNPNLSHG